MGNTSNNLINRINQHLPKSLLTIRVSNKEKEVDKVQKLNSGSAIEQHLINIEILCKL